MKRYAIGFRKSTGYSTGVPVAIPGGGSDSVCCLDGRLNDYHAYVQAKKHFDKYPVFVGAVVVKAPSFKAALDKAYTFIDTHNTKLLDQPGIRVLM